MRRAISVTIAGTGLVYRTLAILILCIYVASAAYARVGGAGGHSSGGSHGGGGHSSSHSSSHTSHHSSNYSGSGGGDSADLSTIVMVIAVVLIVIWLISKSNGWSANTVDTAPVVPAIPFPHGLDAQKVGISFLAIQDAWSRKDLTGVRRWLSDGMYQRLTTQFVMMNKLDQVNVLNSIHIAHIAAVNTDTDGNFHTVDVAISFTMDDSFTSGRYPQFNEDFRSDGDTEYWTFIKRTDSSSEKDLYDNANCPNCGAPFVVKMGEICRCASCNTLANSASYDWVLSEITQAEAYGRSRGAKLSSSDELNKLLHTDPFFAVQRMEDIASNVFMQVMQVCSGDDVKALSRFADGPTTFAIMQQKQNIGSFLFDRLYLDRVTLSNYRLDGDIITLGFDVIANYRRVAINGKDLHMLDEDFVTQRCTLQLSRSKDVYTKAGVGETVYSHECSSCGAPFTDTTIDHCTYCDEPTVDKKRNWVLTEFNWG